MLEHTYRVIVCGSRNWEDHGPIRACLEELKEQHGDNLVVITGACRGADRIALGIAIHQLEIDGIGCPARWASRGKPAGPERNALMLERYRPHEVIGFTEELKGGTADMLSKALDDSLVVHWHDGAKKRGLVDDSCFVR